MFGYIKLDSNCPRIAKTIFKKNYCMLCRSIEKNYGQKSRMLLSYDVTFMLMLFSNQDYLKQINSVKCFKTTKEIKEKTKDELIKKCAALNLAMAEAELYDHINDDKSLIAKLLLKIYKKPFKKVEIEYPTMRKMLIEGYKKFDVYEKENRSLEEIESMFADLILDIAKQEFNVTDAYILKELSFVAKWLYFIDACDDLDKDIKTNSFNPLKEFKSCKMLFNNNHKFISDHLDYLKGGIVPLKTDDINQQITNRIVFCGIPESTYKVAMRIKEHEIVC